MKNIRCNRAATEIIRCNSNRATELQPNIKRSSKPSPKTVSLVADKATSCQRQDTLLSATRETLIGTHQIIAFLKLSIRSFWIKMLNKKQAVYYTRALVDSEQEGVD